MDQATVRVVFIVLGLVCAVSVAAAAFMESLGHDGSGPFLAMGTTALAGILGCATHGTLKKNQPNGNGS